MSSFYGARKRRHYFEGWYLKQQSHTGTIALIPAFHIGKAGAASASLQVVTDTQAYHMEFPAHSFYAERKKLHIRLGNCVFSQSGCELDIRSDACELNGSVRFGPFTPLSYDIMGPFCMVPFMECRHSVFSMLHRVDGVLSVNGKQFVFENGAGYMEGDRGVSFPNRYVWTQGSWNGNSIMLSIAEIPMGAFSFTGCIGFIYFNGRTYRIATYCGVRLLYISNDMLLIRQGKLELKIKLIQENGRLLRAPHKGSMLRAIHESVSCAVQYTCAVDGKILFDFTSSQASFENNWRNTDEPIK